MPRKLLVVFPIALWLSACGGSDAPADAPETEIPEGATVVVGTEQGTWTPAQAWTVEEVLSLGGVDAVGPHQFGLIAGVDVDENGNFYVADRQAQDVRVFDPSGEYLRTIGRPGGGPGEFGGNIGGVFVMGEHVVVPDVANQRVSRFTMDGSLVSSERVSANLGVPIRWDVASGRLVAQRRTVVPGDEAVTEGDPVVTVAAEGQPIDTIATLAVGQSVQITGGLPKIRQFHREPVWDTAVDGRLVTAATNAWRFEVRDEAGEIEWIATRPWEAEPVAERHRDAVRRSLREMYRRQGVPDAAASAVIDGMEFADTLPAFASLAFGPEGSLWVQEFSAPDGDGSGPRRVLLEDMGSTAWGVFDRGGEYLGRVRFPTDFRPTRALGDRFYGIARDALDVETVKVFRVETQVAISDEDER